LLKPCIFDISGCYALPPEESLSSITVAAASSKDPTQFCQLNCLSKGAHYFYIKKNITCQCISKIPLGG